MQTVYLTEEEIDKLEAELYQLKTVERPKVIQSISTAREHGDLKENAEYHAAKEKQVLIELKIQRFEDIMSRTQVIDNADSNSTKVHIGKKLVLLNLNTNDEMTCMLVGTAELDIYGDIDVISAASPVGKLVIGKSVGDIIEVDIPSGVLKYKIKEVL